MSVSCSVNLMNQFQEMAPDSLQIKNKLFMEAVELLINDVMLKPYPYKEKKRIINCILGRTAAFLDIQKIQVGQPLLKQCQRLH